MYFRSTAATVGKRPTKVGDVVSHSQYRMTKVPNPRVSNDLRGVLVVGNQYLSTIDSAGRKADDRFAGSLKEGDSIGTNSAALLMCSSGRC
jgi:hypothetical protein